LAGSVSASLTNFLIISTSRDGSGEYSSISANTFGFCISWSLKIAISGWMMAQLASFWFGEVGVSSTTTSYSPKVLSRISGIERAPSGRRSG
jgi:hypothetical protein